VTLSDPVVRSGLRQSFNMTRLLPLIPLVVVESANRPQGRAVRIGLFALCYAAPQAAAYLLEMEHDGRLDQIRLSGRRPTALATLALTSVATPWLVIGLALTSLGLVRGEVTFMMLVAIVTIAGIPTTLAALSTTVTFARARIDPRIGIAALGVAAMAIGLIGADNIDVLPGAVPGFPLVLVPEAAVIGYCLWTLPRRIAHPPTNAGARPSRFRLPPWDWLLRRPGVYRGALLSSSGFALFGLFAPMGIMVRILSDRNPNSVATPALYLPPLFIGLIAVSLICREDAISRRLDIVRQGSKAVASAACEMLIGLWAPFVAATAGLMLLTAVLFGLAPSEPGYALVALVIMAPLPLIEGLSGLWPMTLVLPIAAAVGFLVAGDWWLAIAVLSAITWISASRMLHHPDRATLSGWQGIVAMSVMCAVTMLPAEYDASQIVALGTVTMMVPLSPLLIDPKSASHRWGQPLAIAITVVLAGSIRFGIQAAVVAAAAVVVVWFASYRIREWDPSRPMVQAAIRVGVMILLGQVADQTFRAAPGRMVQWLASFGVLAIAIGLAALVETVFRIATAIARRRRIYSASMNG
jgi:hypothetical protein